MKQLNMTGLLALMMLTIQVVTAQGEIKSNQFILGGTTNLLIQNNTYPLASLSISSGIGGIYSNNSNETKNTSFALTPYVGKEINQNWLIGMLFDFRVGKYINKDIQVFGQSETFDLERNSNQIGFGIFFRYLLNPENKLNIFLLPHLEFNLLKENERNNSTIMQREKAQYIELSLSPGLKYRINNTFNALLRFGGINYVNGNWRILETEINKDFYSFGYNFTLSNLYFGLEIKL